MEHLRQELDRLLGALPDADQIRSRLDSLASVYPFNEYEFIISHLLARKKLDPNYSGQYDFLLDGKIRIEVKASRGVDASIEAPLYVKALSSDSVKPFWMNFQQIKPACCDVVVWIAVWRDVIRAWVLSSHEVETNPYYSKGQHRGNVGEGQLHITHENIRAFDSYAVQPNKMAEALREAYRRQEIAKKPG